MGTPIIDASAYPATLLRWLNVNAVAPLGRIRTYVDMPAFSQAHTWRGYSDIVAAFNVASPNNISLIGISSVLPTAPNYLLCVSYVNSDREVVRYKLWEDVGEVLYFNVPLYTGQLLKKNFRFEIWSTASSPAVQVDSIRFTTSILGNIDTRRSGPTSLATAGGQIDEFGADDTVPALPDDVNNLMLSRFISTAGYTAGVSWTDQKAGYVQASADLTRSYIENAYQVVQSSGTPTAGAVIGTHNYLFMAFYFGADALGAVVDFDGKHTIEADGGSNKIIVNGQDIAMNGTDKLYFIYIINNLAVYVYDAKTQQFVSPAPTWGAASGSTTLSLLDVGGLGTGIVELVTYNTVTSFQTIYNYFAKKYGGFSLPLVFPAECAPVLNN